MNEMISIIKEDVLELIEILKDKIDNAQEDFGNLDWISKKQALEIIDKELKARIEGESIKLTKEEINERESILDKEIEGEEK